MNAFRILFFVFLFSGFSSLYGQDLSLPQKKTVAVSDTIIVDTMSIVPGSVSFEGITDTSLFRVDYASGKIIWLRKENRPDSLHLSYRAYPVNFTRPARHKDIGLLRRANATSNPFTLNLNKKNETEDPFRLDGLTKSGSLSRGVAFGNAQDVSVSSNLNLQVSGKITDNIELLMAASDDNIPVQPDGTTQQLQEFDKVFIQLSDKKSKLIAGDFFLSRPESRFMVFNKRAQGLYASTTLLQNQEGSVVDSTKLPLLKVRAAAAVSRGKFSRQLIIGVEGNQGPYRLRGAENEAFIVVLAGTERVFVDGLLLRRGQEFDYVIDYNTAEITFTARQQITKDKRITVEFQYSDRNYARSLFTTGADWRTEKLGLRFNYYTEQDSKNQPLQQQLSQQNKQLLATVGDTLTNAVTSSADSIAFSNSEVLYKKRDTLANSILYNDVFVYSTNADSAHWRVTFSNVGQGNGDYVQVNSSANGKVFKWIAPAGNVRQGNYAPLVQLVSPKQRRMITAAADYKASKATTVSVETSLSENDLNTFSRIDDNDNRGYGVNASLINNKIFGDSLPLQITSSISYELVTRTFTPIERFRSVEFERDWNLGSISRTATADQHIASAGIGVSKKKSGTASYRFSYFSEGETFGGGRHETQANWGIGGFRVVGTASYLHSKGDLGRTNFFRSKADFSQRAGKKLVIGIKEDVEQNYANNPGTDSLRSNSAAYLDWQAYLRSADTSKRSWNIYYRERTDRLSDVFALTKAAQARTAGFSLDWNIRQTQQIRTTAGYRTLDILRPNLISQQPENSLVGRIEYTLRAWKGALSLTSFYETGSGLEVKKEFSYIEVTPGQGFYAWTDYNGNGVKELSEFEIAMYPDQARYLRVYVPTSDYIRVYANQFSQSIQLRPSTIWNGKKGIRKFLALFSDQASYRIDRKTSDGKDDAPYNPFLSNTSDTALVSLNSSLRNTVFFNQLGSKFGLEYALQDVRAKNLLTNGYESRTQQFQEFRVRWNITKAVSFTTSWRDGRKSSASQFFGTRNFNLRYYETEPKLSWQPGTVFRISALGRYAQKQNAEDLGNQHCEVRKGGIELRYTVLSKGSFTAEADYVEMIFADAQNTPVAYEMLEGLKAGKNYTWKISWQRSLANNMQLNVGYEGRSSPNVRVIHTGSASVRAFF